jgi:hypothetical protein
VSRKTYLLPLIVAAAFIAVVLAIPYLIEGRLPSPLHLWNLGIFGSVAKYLFSFVGVWVTYKFSKSFIETSYEHGHVGETWLSELKQYLLCIGSCALIAFGVALTLGTHKEDADPVLGGGTTVVDFEPTNDERIRKGLVFFFCLSVPAMCGMHESLGELRKKRSADDPHAK